MSTYGMARLGPAMAFMMLLLKPGTGIAAGEWTLEASVQRALERAPEIAAVDGEIRAGEGEREQAGRWPNPSLELGASDRIGRELSKGGSTLTEFSLSQPLPLGGRLSHARAVAGARVEALGAAAESERLRVEHEIALRFHGVQLSAARLALSQGFLVEAEAFRQVGRRRAEAGELSSLERMRLDLVREEAYQQVNSLEGDHSDAMAQLRPYLDLPEEAELRTVPLGPVPEPLSLEELSALADRHPRKLAARLRQHATERQVAHRRAERIADWELALALERDVFDGRKDEVTALRLRIPLPLWDQRQGAVKQALGQAEVEAARARVLERDLDAALRNAHAHLHHLITQAEHHRRQVLEPASQVYRLSRLGFEAGEVDLLGLIDAAGAYFSAQGRYLELLHDGWLEAAALRFAAGLSLASPPRDGP